MRIKKKLQQMLDKAIDLYELNFNELDKVVISDIYLINTGEPYVFCGSKNGYNTMIVLIRDEQNDKYYASTPSSNTDVILFVDCNFAFSNIDIPTELGCIRISGFRSNPPVLKAVGDSIILGKKE